MIILKFCTHCGKELFDEAVVCPNCGCPVKDIIVVDESISAFMVILAFLVPVIGVIYWAIKAKTRPKCAKACGIVAIIGWVIWYFIGFGIGYYVLENGR